MDIHIQWQDEAKRIVRLNCSGVWNWCELDAQMDRWLAEHQPCTEQLVILLDVRKLTMIPSDVILHIKPAVQFIQEANALVVVLAASAPAITMYTLFVTIYKSVGQKFQLASSDEEALALVGYRV